MVPGRKLPYNLKILGSKCYFSFYLDSVQMSFLSIDLHRHVRSAKRCFGMKELNRNGALVNEKVTSCDRQT